MIVKATLQDAKVLSEMGAETFYDAHKQSAPAHELDKYMSKVYNLDSIEQELGNRENIYHIIRHDKQVAGFSKMELNMNHPAIEVAGVSQMHRIYLLGSFRGLKLGAQLLNFNINYSKLYGQHGMWLIVWVGNRAAITFYEKFGFNIIKKENYQLTDTHVNPCYIMFLKY